MTRHVVIDTGPLVALLNRREALHERVKAVLPLLPTPLLTVEPVLTEAMFLLRADPVVARSVIGLVKSGLLRTALSVEQESKGIDVLLSRYASVPMSLADGCIVRVVELAAGASVFTFDSDFRVYRAGKNRVIQLVDY